jgi:hypothetical protein
MASRPSVPIEYEIIIQGQLDAHWANWFTGLSLEPQPDGRTLLRGCLPDQSALQGVLGRIFDMNLELVSVQAHPGPHQQGTD